MDERITMSDALAEAIRRSGSQSALARLCGLSATAVWKWVRGGQPLPAEHVLKVEFATGISRHDLRPDIYPREESSSPGIRPDETPGAGAPLPAPGVPGDESAAA